MSSSPAFIGATNVLCATGGTTEQVWASARAGIGRIVSSEVLDGDFEPISMGLVPEDALGKLVPALEVLPLPPRARRLLRLAAPSLKSVGQNVEGPVPLFIGLPELSDQAAPWLRHLPDYLRVMTGAVDPARTALFPHGRAASLMALERALTMLDANPAATAIVGGVDSYLDPDLLAALDDEQRLLGPRVMDGFIAGEGAAFFVLSGPDAAGDRRSGIKAVVNGASSTMDPGHLYGTEPAKGEGLAVALEQLRRTLNRPAGPIATTFAGFSGESFYAKLWSVACSRQSDFFSPDMVVEHPADKFGDAGAAMGAILTALAAQSLTGGTRRGPALVWAASDREPRACAVVSTSGS